MKKEIIVEMLMILLKCLIVQEKIVDFKNFIVMMILLLNTNLRIVNLVVEMALVWMKKIFYVCYFNRIHHLIPFK